jgi:intracellular multiplication protein IcmD
MFTICSLFIMKHIKHFFYVVVAMLLPCSAYAVGSIGDVAGNISLSLSSVSGLVSVICYITGMAFGMSAIMKYKTHRDNPQQMPLSTPVTETVLSLALIFLPLVAKMSGSTMFGESNVEHTSPTGEISSDPTVVPSGAPTQGTRRPPLPDAQDIPETNPAEPIPSDDQSNE